MSDAPATARSRRTAARARGRGPGRRYNLWLGGLLIGTIVAGALLGFVWSPHPPNTMDFTAQLQPPSAEHWLGTDHFGRDLFSRLLVGARGTLYVGFIAVGIALVAGTEDDHLHLGDPPPGVVPLAIDRRAAVPLVPVLGAPR